MFKTKLKPAQANEHAREAAQHIQKAEEARKAAERIQQATAWLIAHAIVEIGLLKRGDQRITLYGHTISQPAITYTLDGGDKRLINWQRNPFWGHLAYAVDGLLLYRHCTTSWCKIPLTTSDQVYVWRKTRHVKVTGERVVVCESCLDVLRNALAIGLADPPDFQKGTLGSVLPAFIINIMQPAGRRASETASPDSVD